MWIVCGKKIDKSNDYSITTKETFTLNHIRKYTLMATLTGDVREELLHDPARLKGWILWLGGKPLGAVTQAHYDNRGAFLSIREPGSEHAARREFPNGAIGLLEEDSEGHIHIGIRSGEHFVLTPPPSRVVTYGTSCGHAE